MVKPLVLLILDGWGIAPPGPGNAISQAKIPNFTRLTQNFPSTHLLAAGEAVGLPKGEDGNTETGHLNLGAGRIVYQDLPRINQTIADGSFFQNETFLQAINHAKNFHSHLHLLGLIGIGGVHSNIEHLLALLQLIKKQQFSDVLLHLFTDGRDSPITSGSTLINQIENQLKTIGIGKIATLMGRYFAMDRDLRWERTEKAYTALTEGKGLDANSAEEAIKASYARQVTDEFIEPTIILDHVGKPLPRIADNDAVIFFNYRIDRTRQLTKAFVLPSFENLTTPTSFDPYAVKYNHKHPIPTISSQPFPRQTRLFNLFFVTMTEYEKGLPARIAFPPQIIVNPLGEVVANQKLKQLRITETEKERFVTYYFNGQREDPFFEEDRIILPSSKVATYDSKPEMSTSQITDTLLEHSASGEYSLIVVNLANADIVGHTGNLTATIKGCEAIDQAIGRIVPTILGQEGTIIITADHGNAEEMIDNTTGETETEHSANPVPLILVSDKFVNRNISLQPGILGDVAPTILKVLNLAKPLEMTGRELF